MRPLRTERPFAPSTCSVVFNASMGMRKMRHMAAEPLAAAVLTPTGKFLVESKESSRVSMPELAAVSPKRDKGP